MHMFTPFDQGGGPVINGPVLPFIFITIACGAISGFHAIIGTGTTPKMIGNEREILFVGYGAIDRKSTRLNSSHPSRTRMPSSA